eukprot:671875-Ditylum_brightwellii.AAC.1
MLKDLDKTLRVSHMKQSLARMLKQILCKIIGMNHERLNNNVWASQAKIKLHAIFDRRMSKKWAQEQDEYLVEVKLWTPRTPMDSPSYQISLG